MVTFHGNHRKALPLIQLINNVATHQKSVNESGSLEPVPDLEYLLDKSNLKTIRENIQNRKGVGDIDLLVSRLQNFVKLEDVLCFYDIAMRSF